MNVNVAQIRTRNVIQYAGGVYTVRNARHWNTCSYLTFDNGETHRFKIGTEVVRVDKKD